MYDSLPLMVLSCFLSASHTVPGSTCWFLIADPCRSPSGRLTVMFLKQPSESEGNSKCRCHVNKSHFNFWLTKTESANHILLSHGYKWLHQCIIMLWHKKKSICLFDLQHDKKYCHSNARATVERVFCIFYLGEPVSLFPSNLSFLYIKFTNQKQKEQFPHQHFLHLLASPSPLLLFLGKKTKKCPRDAFTVTTALWIMFVIISLPPC